MSSMTPMETLILLQYDNRKGNKKNRAEPGFFYFIASNFLATSSASAIFSSAFRRSECDNLWASLMSFWYCS